MSYYIYGHSVRGTSHDKTKTPCQDSCKFIDLQNGWVVAAVADGVGSAVNSKVGSEMAVETAVNFVASYMPVSLRENGIKRTIYCAYNAALKKIKDKAEQDRQPLESYDTTLSLVVFNGDRLYYGHAGDGGIFGLTVYGDYSEITKPHNGKDGSTVVPLRGGEDTWEIDAFRGDVLTSVLLLTDGMRGEMRPYELGTGEKDLYIPMCSFLMHPGWYRKHEREYSEITKDFLDGNLKRELLYKLLSETYLEALQNHDMVHQTVNTVCAQDNITKMLLRCKDDKTALAIIGSSVDKIPALKAVELYAEPNWAEKKAQSDKELYPSRKDRGVVAQPPVVTAVISGDDAFQVDSNGGVSKPSVGGNQSEPNPIRTSGEGGKNGKKKQSKLLEIVIVIVVFLAVIGGISVFSFFSGLFSYDDAMPTNTNTTSTSEPLVSEPPVTENPYLPRASQGAVSNDEDNEVVPSSSNHAESTFSDENSGDVGEDDISSYSG
ncbi:hypothetical protein Hs30E_08700 [Lactococcus hodotermopsidis]|uniref:PPM-type phosphatase domain-containing protein n=1 Tax=Pseudolactococcus hodotermopsidis TaxID=2709157 RepID=A0A6A0BA74_9LACT|nr:PP2C family serine/threonine-protein phosphatase [Lactococcus hodotermopsidis]GFH42319.1 hypothetical protein Hs30E_08700 [Lactococcus hodotermopsidis]